MADGNQTLTPPPDPVTGGEFLLQLLRQPPRFHQPTPPIPIAHDPAVAAVGRGFPLSPPPGFADLGGPQFAPWMFPPGVRPSPPGFSPKLGFGGGFVENPGLNRDVQLVLSEDGRLVANQGRFEIRNGQGRCLDGGESSVGRGQVREVDSYAEIGWGRNDGLSRGERGKGAVASVSLGNQWRHEGPVGKGGGRVVGSGSREKESGQLGCANERVGRQYAAENGVDLANRDGHSGIVRNSKKETLQRQVVGGVRPERFDVVTESDIDRVRMLQHQGRVREERQHVGNHVVGSAPSKATPEEENLLVKQFEDSLTVNEESVEKNESKVNGSRSKDFRSDFSRGHHVSSQRMRIRRGAVACRRDISRLTPSFLFIFKSLVPAEEEITKQRKLLSSLKVLVKREWPDAELHLYGSCANSFGVSNSDIDICLAIDDTKMSKSEIILRLADVLQEDNLQDVQALTRARVPIVKLKDPKTGMSCDICINNLLAVVNTKLLRDYAQIDERLRQLAFLVKHWAKSRDVNETYQGTLSSYAYVLMCIHFLQQRMPPILPSLQEMQSTYAVTVDDVQCSYFDKIEELRNFGASNRESVAELLWSFFNYWAFQHDYANDVISVRTGGFISKQAKDWTRRIGNDRHLICIEDPFETSHDLGRVVDKRSIRILREEFERAADVLQYDQNPCVTLFERYVRQPTEEKPL